MPKTRNHRWKVDSVGETCGQLDYLHLRGSQISLFRLYGHQEKNVKRIRLQIFNFKEEVTISNLVEKRRERVCGARSKP